jgi:dTDP-glucose 4,6-dehydratase
MSKHLIITGGAGFIGHHTIEHILKNTDWCVTTIDRLTYAGDLNRLTDIEDFERHSRRLKFVYHDFRASLPIMRLERSIRAFGKPAYFIHMGAESHVDRSIEDPLLFAESNVIGTVNMLNLGRALGVEKFIYVSTDEVYGPSVNGHLHAEGEPHKPGNPYSASKSAGEAFCHAYYNTYGFPVLVTNTMNNFGERQDPEKFVPKTLKALIEKKPVTIHVKKDENGAVTDISSRCWLHARNHADALLFLLEHGEAGEHYNVTGERKDVAELANLIGAFAGVQPELVYEDFHSFRRGHDMHYGLDGSKLSALGWKPKFTLEKSLQQTIEWSLNNKWWLL